jgi:putative ABC transport system permease protein
MTLLWLRPWRRGPLLLWKRPGVALALAAAAFVATLPAAAAPLFLSAARSATLHHQLAQACPGQVAAQITTVLGFPDLAGSAGTPFDERPVSGTVLLTKREGLADRAAAQVPGLGTAVHTFSMPVDTASGALNLTYRDGYRAHVTVLDGPRGTGVWLPDQYAAFAGLRVGDLLRIPARTVQQQYYDGNGGFETRTATLPAVDLPIAAIYADLRARPDDPYWCTLRTLYRGQPGDEFSNKVIPPMVLLDREPFLDVAVRLHAGAAQFIEYPLANPRLTEPDARRTADGVARMRSDVYNHEDGIFDSYFTATNKFASSIGRYADRADLVRRGLLPPVVPITGAGVLVGLLVVAAAALFWVQRRARELTVLAAHGVSPAGLGLKAVTEALPALAVGAAAGWAAAWVLVRVAGPSPVLSEEAAPGSLRLAAAALVAAVAMAGVTAGVRCRGLTDQRARHGLHLPRAASLPWELLLLAAAWPAWTALGGSRETAAPPGGVGAVAGVPGRLLVVPIMVVAGVSVLGARLAARWLRRRATRRTPSRTAPFLAWRRLGRESTVAATLAAATAIPIALAAFGGAVTGSVRATLSAEAKVAVGADVVLTLSKPAPVPPSLAGHTTEVLRLGGAKVGGVQADILAVDPATFVRDAFWDRRVDGVSMADLMAVLRRPGGLGTVPMVGSRPVPGGEQAVSWGGDPLLTAQLTTVAKLPAEQGGYPVLLMDRSALRDGTRYAVPQLWVRGDPDRIRRAALAANLPLARIQVAADRYADTIFEPLTYTFDYLAALSVLTGLIAVVGLLLYLEGRAPAHRRGYVLLRRMGLRPRSHRWALVRELALPLGAGLVGGLGIAAALVAAVRADIEINPDVPPDTVVAAPTATIAGTTAAIALLTLLAAAYAHRRVARADPAEVLRDTA